MKRSSGKMRRGFMCQSTAASAACMAGDPRSVVMPRKLERILIDNDHHHDQGLGHSTVRYSRLVQSRRFHDKKIRSSASTAPVSVHAPTLRDVIKVDHQLQLQKPRAGASSTPDQVFQVVVMRVSLHCQGCAGKVKKHLSKMEGVTSFSIDLESKRVTVMGHVSPDGVLESVSKVKKAELWPAS